MKVSSTSFGDIPLASSANAMRTTPVTAAPATRETDTGPGLAEPDKVFEPFYSTKSLGKAEGVGLGLSISYGLVQSFGGNIKGTNAPEGGAIFEVELKKGKEAAE